MPVRPPENSQPQTPTSTVIATEQSKDAVNIGNLCKPDNEMFRRYQDFLNGGPRVVIPDLDAIRERRRAEPTASGTNFCSGGRVRVVGLKTNTEINGQEGSLVQYDEVKGRWHVLTSDGKTKMVQSKNLEKCDGRVLEMQPIVNGSLTEESRTAMLVGPCILPDLNGKEGKIVECDEATDPTSAGVELKHPSDIAHFCEQNAAALTVADILSLVRRLSHFNDLEVIPPIIVEHTLGLVDHCRGEDIVDLLVGFSALGNADVMLFDVLISTVLRHKAQLSPAKLIDVVKAFAHAGLLHFEAFDELATAVTPVLGSLSDAELVSCAVAFADVETFERGFFCKLCAEIKNRANQLHLGQLSLLARIVGLQADASEVSESVLKALTRAVKPQITRPEHLALSELASFLDALPGLRRELSIPVITKTSSACRQLQNLDPFSANGDSVQTLCRDFLQDLGVFGTVHLMQKLGVSNCTEAFVRRAVSHITWSMSSMEDWNVHTVQRRTHAFVEYQFSVRGSTPVKGNFVCTQGHTPVTPRFLINLSSRGQVERGELCIFFKALEEICQRIVDAGVIFGARQVLAGVCGSVEAFLSVVPATSGWLALRDFQRIFPCVKLAFSTANQLDIIGIDDGMIECEDEVLDVDLADEVIDIKLPVETVEAVD